jgi:HEAT repeat protein
MRCPLVIGCLLLAGCASRAGHAIALYETGDYAGAARSADAELTAHPGDEALWQMRIRAALALGDARGVATAYAAYRDRRDGDDDRPLLRDLAIASLGQALASPSVKLKIAAIQAVEAAELEPLADPVAQRMRDDDDRVVATAAAAVLHGAPDAPQAIGDMLHSEDAEARRIAVDGIGRKVGKVAASVLETAAGDPDPHVRRAAVRWLGQLKDADAAPILTQRLRDPDEAVRAAAASALAHLGAPGLGTLDLGALARIALSDHALAVRLGGVELAAAAHDRATLTSLADDPDAIIAAEAAIATGDGAAAARAIERAAAAAVWSTRAGAANLAIRALGKTAAVAVAHKLAGDADIGVRLAAARVLSHNGDPATAAAIFASALATDHRIDAAIDLAMLDDQRGIAALNDAVGDLAHGPANRAAAATAHRTAHRITPGLVAALADDSGAVRVEAAAVLALMTRP